MEFNPESQLQAAIKVVSEGFQCSRCGAPLEKSGPLCETCVNANVPSMHYEDALREIVRLGEKLDAVVAAEKERCAKVAEHRIGKCSKIWNKQICDGYSLAALEIANMIRSGQ